MMFSLVFQASQRGHHGLLNTEHLNKLLSIGRWRGLERRGGEVKSTRHPYYHFHISHSRADDIDNNNRYLSKRADVILIFDFPMSVSRKFGIVTVM